MLCGKVTKLSEQAPFPIPDHVVRMFHIPNEHLVARRSCGALAEPQPKIPVGQMEEAVIEATQLDQKRSPHDHV
jgi:hypothetical protein